MDVSNSWKGGKALIYTHRFPGIFIGLAKCHYTAGGEVMNCNKLWCGWVCVSCHWLINRNTVTSLKRSTTLPPPVVFLNAYNTHAHTYEQESDCVQAQTHVQCSHTETRVRPAVIVVMLTEQFSLHDAVWKVSVLICEELWVKAGINYILSHVREYRFTSQCPWICSNIQYSWVRAMQQIDPSC